ncbi:YifB family Mg chelatase-like AAA ATPase [Pedococcus ginsenosidimutans]|uniref:YifB family Mg chelatase-like AAA ATPase n=1 Tax=Pedococcus ginsenosidimutans TaxID=490570 RepID=A0ABP8XZ47_9MICO
MSFGRTRSVTLEGLDGAVVDVEAHLSGGLPAFMLGGLPDTACAQSPNRVKAATASIGRSLAQDRITVNLSPASIPKNGSGFDLPIAVAVLAAVDLVPAARVADTVHLGELGLNGEVRRVRGILPAVLCAARAGCTDVVVPEDNAAEASLVPGIRVHAVRHLNDLVAAYRLGPDRLDLGVPESATRPVAASRPVHDLADVVGQPEARTALELAAAGGHHLFLLGPPGSGKTMLAERLVSVLPRLTREQSIDVLAVRSLLGVTAAELDVEGVPPFVAPHHSATQAAIIGGGSSAVRPGAISQAHHGVLFLDEAPEFRTGALQALRQPLESGEVVVARARTAVRFPARFQLVMAANPCPCGLGFGKGIGCSCTPLAKRNYVGRLSGPLLDRVDLQVHVPAVSLSSLGSEPGESSASVAARVAEARAVQAERWSGCPWQLNSHVPGAFLRRGTRRLGRSVTADIDRALDRGQLTLRGYDRVLRLGWTVADLAGRVGPTRDDLGTALTLRNQGPVAA